MTLNGLKIFLNLTQISQKAILKKVMKNLHNLYNDLPFFHERMGIEKVEKLVANMHDKEGYVIPLTNPKLAINHGIVLKENA